MHKAEKKAGMHKDSAMYMNSPIYKGHSPMEMGHSPMEMGHSPMEMGHESPAEMGHSPMEMGHESPAKKYDSPMHKESRELKDMPIVDIEKGKAKGAGRINARKEQPKSKREYGSPAKAAKPDYIDIDGDGDKSESMKEAAKDKKSSPANMKRGSKDEKSGEQPMKESFKPPKYDPKKRKEYFEKKKGSPAEKYDKVVLGGNKGDKSKTKPGKKDYEK